MAATRESHALSASRSQMPRSRVEMAPSSGGRPRRADAGAGTTLAVHVGPRPWRWWMRQPVHARRAFRGLVQIGLAVLGYGALLARPQAGALGALGGMLYAVAGWGAYPLLALLLAWGVALVGVGLTRRAPLSRLQLVGAVAETLALLLAVRVVVGHGAGGWLAGVLAHPVAGLPPLVARILVIALALVLLIPLARVGPRTASRAAARLVTRSSAPKAQPQSPTDAPPSTALPTEQPAARSPNGSQPERPLRYVESTPPTTREPSAPPPRALLAAPATTPPTDLTATPTRIIETTPTTPGTFTTGQGWPTAGRTDVPWQAPPLDLFDAPATRVQIDQQALLALAARLDAALRRAGIDAWVPREDMLVGPALLTFVLIPPPHMRREWAGEWLDHVLQRRAALLAALGIPEARVTLPPADLDATHESPPDLHPDIHTDSSLDSSDMHAGARVWVQVPHASARRISLHEVVTARTIASADSLLALPLGRATTGEARGVDLAQSAHLVIGGGPRTGKSTLVQTLLAGMLARATPRNLALALADPTRRALGEFEGLPHLLAPVAITPAALLSLLDTALTEADRRERLLVDRGATSFAAYRARCQGRADPSPLPYIVLVLDAVEAWDAPTQRALAHRVTRLAGIGRLTGISLILAGQTPAATPLFRALEGMLAARVAFAIDSATDSRGILGIGGAEDLTRAGDLLSLPVATGTVERIHAARVSDEELHRLTRFWKRQAALAASEDATTIPGLYSAPEDATILLADARGQQVASSTPISDSAHDRDSFDTPLALPPLPGRQPWGALSRMEGDASPHLPPNTNYTTNTLGGMPLAMVAQMMRALVARSEQESDDTDTFGGR